MEAEKGTDLPAQTNVIYSDGTDQIQGLDEHIRQVAYQVQQWASSLTEKSVGSMLDRQAYSESDNPLRQIQHAHRLMETNDIVAGFAELTEGLAYQGTKWESAEPEIQDVWNQMAAEQDLDSLVRKVHRETFATSQVVLAMWWDRGTFQVRGKTPKGNARKKVYEIAYPRFITVLDSRRVIPVGMLAFGQERLAWQATSEEMAAFDSSAREGTSDEVVRRFFVDRYRPLEPERMELSRLGVDTERLILLNPDLVRRHTLTRSDYERWAPVRLRSLFQLHDMRQQLMEADRVALVGAANYILVVKKGDKDRPATTEEIQNVKAGFRTLAKVPVIFSDHRLEIEIITPKQDYTLNAEKYDLIDSRIIQRLVNTVLSSQMRQSSTVPPIGKTVVAALEGRRHMLRRFLEVVLAREVMKHPANADAFKASAGIAPSFVYTPARISLDDEAAIASALIQLRTMRELSRETLLERFGIDQEAEALRMQLEAEVFDDIFKSQVPFSSPNQQPPADGQQPANDGQQQPTPPVAQAPAGARGGRPKGGGKPSQDPSNIVSGTGNSSTKGN